ncbi:MAG: peptidoglycan recognition protein family protein [Ruminococcus sp.]|nr:peptidoglycan recognition protein family protein [Ruminococcus sp.]MCM1154863.1 peptidoglycan recognition protein family protein [Roseburia sp.]
MAGSVHKKKTDVELWEIVTTPRKTRPVQDYRQKRSPQALRRRRARKRQVYLYRMMAFCTVTLCAVLVCGLLILTFKSVQEWRRRDIIPVTKVPVIEETEITKITAPDIMTSYLDINDYSRPGTKLDSINTIFVHYTANPGTSAEQNRSYFANLAQTHERSASAHFIIGYEGEIIQCIPLEEQAYAVMTRNGDSISIECCYLEKDGEFTQATYDSLVHLLAWLIQEYDLEVGDILRHYDCGGKKCPLYYVENEYAWDKLLLDVGAYQ